MENSATENPSVQASNRGARRRDALSGDSASHRRTARDGKFSGERPRRATVHDRGIASVCIAESQWPQREFHVRADAGLLYSASALAWLSADEHGPAVLQALLQ